VHAARKYDGTGSGTVPDRGLSAKSILQRPPVASIHDGRTNSE